MAPTDYEKDSTIPLYTNALTSTVNVPYDYYREEFKFCQPKEIKSQPESLGSILFGDRIFNSPFEVFLFS